MMKILTVLLSISLLFCACGGVYTADRMNGVEIDVEHSWLSDYCVNDDLVYIYCKVHVDNPSNNEVKVQFIGYFTEDYEAGLLAEAEIIGRCDDQTTVMVPAGGETFDIIFCGDYGGTPVMQDRLLPEIEVVVVEGIPVCVGDNATDALGKCKEIAEVASFSGSVFLGRNANYLFLVGTDGHCVTQIAVYTTDKTLVYAEGIDPVIPICTTDYNFPMPLEKLTFQLGMPHFDKGSGVYIPSYVTDDAVICCFVVSDSMVCALQKYEIDSFISKVVER